MFGFKMSWFQKLVVVGMLPLFFVGCLGIQPQIRLPSRNASRQDRIQAYDEYRAVVIRRTISYSRYGRHEHNRLQLNNGIVIYNPWSLVDIVGDNTRTAKFAQRYSTYKRNQRIMFWSSFAVGIAGTGLVLASSVFVRSSAVEEFAFIRSPVFWSGIVVTSLASVSMVLANPIFGTVAARYQRRSYRSYNRDLRARLGISRHDLYQGQEPTPPPRQGNPSHSRPSPQDHFEDTNPNQTNIQK